MNAYVIKFGAVCMFIIAAGCSRQGESPMPTPSGSGEPKAAYEDGRAEAHGDIANGKIILKTYGLPAPWASIYHSKLLNQYQIISQPVAGCVVTETLMQSVKGYNEVSVAEIERRYGTGLLQRVAKEAELAWQQRQANK